MISVFDILQHPEFLEDPRLDGIIPGWSALSKPTKVATYRSILSTKEDYAKTRGGKGIWQGAKYEHAAGLFHDATGKDWDPTLDGLITPGAMDGLDGQQLCALMEHLDGLRGQYAC